MSDDRMKTQRAEFDALDKLIKSYDGLPPIVDDDYPEARHYFEGALVEFIAAMYLNKRFDRGNRYGLRPAAVEDVSGDAAIAIGEDAFKAGYKSAADRARAYHPTRIEDDAAHMEKAWSEYEPPEDIKALTQ
jgi:hypothetical protein